MGALAADDTDFVSPFVVEKIAAALFNPVLSPLLLFELLLVVLVFVKPPRPPKPPKPAVLPKPKLLDGESGVVVFAWLPGAPTPMGDLDGLGGATGSLLLSWVLMDDGKAVEVDIFENKPSRKCLFFYHPQKTRFSESEQPSLLFDWETNGFVHFCNTLDDFTRKAGGKKSVHNPRLV